MSAARCEWSPEARGALFRVTNDAGEAIRFPLGPDPSIGSPAVRLLEALWYEERLEDVQEGLVLPYREIYRLESAARGELGLPAEDTPIAVELRSEGFARGRGDFGVRAIARSPDGGLLAREDRIGAFVRIGGAWALAPETAGDLFSIVDGFEARQDRSLEDELLFVGRVVEAAANAGASIDPYLRDQHIIASEGIGIEVNSEDPRALDLRPVAMGPDGEPTGFDLGRGRTGSTYFQRKGTHRTRLVVPPDQRKASDTVKRGGHLEGPDVPRFLSNPEAFLPDSIDLERFSLRVRGLVPKRYNSKPYVQLTDRKDRDWFAASLEVEATPAPIPYWEKNGGANGGPVAGEGVGAGGAVPVGPDLAGDVPPQVTPERYAELCEQVVETGEAWVLEGDSWIEIDPNSASDYLRAWEAVEPDGEGGYQIPRERAALILDVISNVEELEFEGPPSAFEFLEDLPEYPEPSRFEGRLHPYQHVGYRWLRFLHDQDYGGLLADDMGLGKTIQVIAFMAHLAEAGALRPCLLVVPSGLVQNWHEELRKFCPSIRHIYHHMGPGRERDPGRIALSEVVITSYATLRRDQLILGQVDWTFIACDEAQKVKNPTAETTAAVKGMKGPLRLALTGTPVENGLSELWCIVDFAQPGKLGSRREFKDEFERPIAEAEGATDQRLELATRLQERLTPHYLRRTKDDVLDNLPPKHERRSPQSLPAIGLSPRQEALYRQTLQAVRSGEMLPIAALQYLIQICSHPDLVEPAGHATEARLAASPKLRVAMDIVGDVERAGEKVLLFTRYLMMQRILQDVVADVFGVHAPILNGEVTGGRRQELVKRFNAEPGFGVMILSPEAAGVGLNITGANHVVHYTRLWNPAKENQATDRVYRIGQRRPVTVYYPIVFGDGFHSVEERLDELLTEKQALARDVVWPRESLSVQKDLERLFKQDAGLE